MNPLQMVALAVSQDSSLSEQQMLDSLHEALNHLMLRADAEIRTDVDGPDAISLARQYQAVSEVILFLGTQLIAFEDIEAEDDVDDERRLKN